MKVLFRIITALVAVVLFTSRSLVGASEKLPSFEEVITDPKSFSSGLPPKLLFTVVESPGQDVRSAAAKALKQIPNVTPLEIPKEWTPIAFVECKTPIFPLADRREGISGSADLLILVNVDGHVVRVLVTNSTKPEFGKSAANAAITWKLKPLMVKGHAAPFLAFLRVAFTINNG